MRLELSGRLECARSVKHKARHISQNVEVKGTEPKSLRAHGGEADTIKSTGASRGNKNKGLAVLRSGSKQTSPDPIGIYSAKPLVIIGYNI